jgi:hypothetical protein
LKIKYFSDDGKEFDTELACKEYEHVVSMSRLTSIDDVLTFVTPKSNGSDGTIKWYLLKSSLDLLHYETMLNGANIHPYDVIKLSQKLVFPLFITPDLGKMRTTLSQEMRSTITKLNELTEQSERLVTYIQHLEDMESSVNSDQDADPAVSDEDAEVEDVTENIQEEEKEKE